MDAERERLAALGENETLRLERGPDSLLAIRRHGRLFVYQNRCPHRGTELDWLPGSFTDPETGLIRCATHGALFEVETGECVAGPCLGQRLATTRIEGPEGDEMCHG